MRGAAMIVRAPHFALRDLLGDHCPAHMKHLANVPSLVAQVVEVEHKDVGLTAVDTGVFEQILVQATPIRRAHRTSVAPYPCPFAVSVCGVVTRVVSPKATAAP
jgi:hypothetical protein